MRPTDAHDSGGDRYQVDAWAQRKGSDPALVAVARALNKWPEGLEISEVDFDRALKAAGDVPLGGAKRT